MKKLNFLAAATFLLGITSALAQNPTLYGMTEFGGAGIGNIIKFNPNPVSSISRYNFVGTIGYEPRFGHMIQATDGYLYGMAASGGANNFGVIFRYDPVTNTYTDLVDFTGTSGSYPGRGALGSLIQATDGNLYGVTNQGGASGFGNMFRYNISTSTYTDLFDFTGNTGAYQGSNARGDLYQASDGKLYGMASELILPNSYGKLYSYDINTSTYTVLFNFTKSTGAYLGEFPVGSVIQATDGNLYGTTNAGATGYGSIFRYNPNTASFTDLIEFTGDAGGYPGYAPYGNLMQATDGNLYGMTSSGGASHDGNIFMYNPTTSTYTDLVDFTGTTGAYIGYEPFGSLIQATDGNIYGMTSEEFLSDGNIFQYNPTTSTYTDLIDFTGYSGSSNGYTPEGDLMEYYFATITVTSNITCYGYDNGSASATASGGVSPYTYAWSNGASTIANSNATGAILSAGSYTLTVTDNKGKSVTATTTITQPPALFRDSVATQTNVGCYGGNGGSAKIGVKGSAAPYTYQWAPNTNSTATATGLTAGVYTVTVTGKYGCSNTVLVTITQPNELSASLSGITYPVCNGEKGSAQIGVTGGITPYTYTWTRGYSTTSAATALPFGSYTVTVKDAHSCSSVVTLTITQPGAIRDSMITADKVNILCNGGNGGSATVGVKFGTPPYTYTWTPNVSSTATATGLSAGTYSVTITDINGCAGTRAMIMITQPANPLRDSAALLVNVGCNGGTGGEISIGTRGGTNPYTYAWSNGKTTYNITGLAAATYTTSITDNHGCSNTLSVTITQPAQLLSVIQDSCEGTTGGLLKVTGNGGAAPYNYLWSNGSTKTAITILNGTYTVTVKDAHGCSYSNSYVLNCLLPEEKHGVGNQGSSPPCCDGSDNINIYPNPSTGQFTVSITNYELGITNNVEIYNMLGQKVYSQSTIRQPQFTINISGQPNGIYLIRILDKDGNLVSQKKVVKTN